MSALVVLIFAVVKFTEGAWLVVVLFPLMWFVLMRLNRRYRDEARALDLVTWVRPDQADAAHYGRHTVLVMVDRLDLAVLRALRYAGSMRPTDVRVVHIVLDNAEAAQLQQQWIERDLCDRYPLEIVECGDRRLVRTVSEIALDTVVTDRAEVTVLLPRRTFRRMSQRLLHDRTADRIAEAVGRIPHVAATIVPFDTTLSARDDRATGEPATGRVGQPGLGGARAAARAAGTLRRARRRSAQPRGGRRSRSRVGSRPCSSARRPAARSRCRSSTRPAGCGCCSWARRGSPVLCPERGARDGTGGQLPRSPGYRESGLRAARRAVIRGGSAQDAAHPDQRVTSTASTGPGGGSSA